MSPDVLFASGCLLSMKKHHLYDSWLEWIFRLVIEAIQQRQSKPEELVELINAMEIIRTCLASEIRPLECQSQILVKFQIIMNSLQSHVIDVLYGNTTPSETIFNGGPFG